jgi:hypothetical protein
VRVHHIHKNKQKRREREKRSKEKSWDVLAIASLLTVDVHSSMQFCSEVIPENQRRAGFFLTPQLPATTTIPEVDSKERAIKRRTSPLAIPLKGTHSGFSFSALLSLLFFLGGGKDVHIHCDTAWQRRKNKRQHEQKRQRNTIAFPPFT